MDALAPLSLAFVSVLHPEPAGDLVRGLRSRFGGIFLVNTGFSDATTRDEAVAMMSDSLADAVVVGRAVIANPHLVHRWKNELEENEVNFTTLYAQGTLGYTDYPTHDAAEALSRR